MLTENLPRRHFAHLPTPIEYLRRLSDELAVDIYIKRDDETGLATGGNKTRKLEFLIAEALAQGCDTVITGGAIQSNHCRQTAAAAAKHGLRCVLVLNGDDPGTLDNYDGNTLLSVLLGAEIRWTDRAHRDVAMQAALEDEQEAGHSPYFIPYGGSNPTGAAGYVAAVEELTDQLKRNPDLPDSFDTIVFASSSGGTQAGLALGVAALEIPSRVLGISIDEEAGALKAKIAKLVNDTAEKLELEGEMAPEDLFVDDSYLGRGYAMVDDAEREAIKKAARIEGLLLDPVYTGRAFAGLLGRIAQGRHQEEAILFWHTGGTVVLPAFRNVLFD